MQESAVTVCVTRSTALMVASAFPIVPMATSACAHWGSEELSVKSVSQWRFCLSLLYKGAFRLLTDGKERDEDLYFYCLFYCISPGFSLSSPLFNETVFSYAVVPWPQSPQSYLSFMEFEVTFRPSLPDGTLLYSDDEGSGDFLAINLVDRYVEFRFDCGSGGATIRFWINKFTLFCVSFTSAEDFLKRWLVLFLCCRSVEQISMDAWHELRVSRTAKSGILQVDSQRPVEGIAEVFLSEHLQFPSGCLRLSFVCIMFHDLYYCYTEAIDWLICRNLI